MQKFNNKLALLITDKVGTMWCVYIFCLLACISLPAALSSHDPVIIVAWLSSNFLQLVLLPALMKGQNLQGEATEKRLNQILDKIEAQQVEEIKDLKKLERTKK